MFLASYVFLYVADAIIFHLRIDRHTLTDVLAFELRTKSTHARRRGQSGDDIGPGPGPGRLRADPDLEAEPDTERARDDVALARDENEEGATDDGGAVVGARLPTDADADIGALLLPASDEGYGRRPCCNVAVDVVDGGIPMCSLAWSPPSSPAGDANSVRRLFRRFHWLSVMLQFGHAPRTSQVWRAAHGSSRPGRQSAPVQRTRQAE